jgi:putative FmdB family regulatory protein
MPTYEYECQKCKKTFEMFQSMKDDAVKTCPETLCRMKKWGKGPVRRLLGTGAGLIFKGSGFYITDYRSENYKQSAKKESGGSETPKTETKPTTASSESKKPSAKKESKP